MSSKHLKQSIVHRQLDSKLKFLGMEALDLLCVMLFAGIMNLLFGKTSLALYLVFLFPFFMAVGLYMGKIGKPENYLLHLLKFYTTSGLYSAGMCGKFETQRKMSICHD